MIHKDTKEFNETCREIEELDPNDFDDRKIPPPLPQIDIFSRI